MISLSILRWIFKVLLSFNTNLLFLNPEVLSPCYLWLFTLTILILYFEDFANYSLYGLRMKLFFKTYRFRDFLVLLLRLMFFWRLFNHYSISIGMFIVVSNLVCFIVIAILFLFSWWVVSKWRVCWFLRCELHSCKYNKLYRIWYVRLHTLFRVPRNRTIIWSIVYFKNVLRKIVFEYLHFENFIQSQILPDWYNYFFNNAILDLLLMYVWEFIHLLVFKWFCSY